MEDVGYIYFSTGDDITLKCDCKAFFWNGPTLENTGMEISQVKYTDINDESQVWNVSIYTNGDTVAGTLPQTLSSRLHVIGNKFDLHMTNLSPSNEGLYTCESECGVSENRFLLQIKTLPTNLEILNVDDNYTVTGKENIQLDLICLVKSGKPPEVLTWRKNRTIIRQGGPSKLVYSFIPDKTDHQSVYSCEVQTSFMEMPLKMTIHLDIQYKPSIKVDVIDPLIEEGKPVNLCCSSRSNPKHSTIAWFKEDTQILSSNSESVVCYRWNNVSRHDTGNYTCYSQNKIGNESSKLLLVISYAPVVTVRLSKLNGDSTVGAIQCMADGEPNSYNYYPWEHRSLFNEHIRYLGVTDTFNGILQLPFANISNKYQDAGFYICNVSNGIPDYYGNIFQQGRVYFESKGPPVFAARNTRIQGNSKEPADEIKVFVYSSSAINCYNITTIGSVLASSKNKDVKKNLILIQENYYGANVTVNGTEITFILNGLNFHGSRQFNVTVCNRYGHSSFVVELKSTVKSSDENTLTSQEIINIVLFIIILVLITGIGVYIKYTKHRYRKRVITEINIQTAERNVAASPHYAEILEDSMLTLPQETDRIVPANSNTTALSDDNSSSSSNTDNIVSDDLNDGYEKPYTTLISNNADEVEHVYRKTKQTLTYENATAFTNASLGHSVELQRFSLDIIETNCNSNEDRENTDMHYEENDTQEIDDDSNRSNPYKQKETVEYINLSLKQ